MERLTMEQPGLLVRGFPAGREHWTPAGFVRVGAGKSFGVSSGRRVQFLSHPIPYDLRPMAAILESQGN